METPTLFLGSISKWLFRLSRTSLVFLAIVLLSMIGVIDYLTGQEISLAIFYLVPVALGTWYQGRWTGILMACFSAVTWTLSNWEPRPHYSHSLILFWNAVVFLAFFLAFATTLSAVKKALVTAKKSAMTEPLTGISNSRAFGQVVDHEIDRARRYSHSLSFAYVDLDNFKAVNDRFGHSTGDILLQAVARTIKQNIRTTDTVARLGGDEFAILLPETGPKSARHSIERIAEKLSTDVQEHGWPVTFSIGVVTFMRPPIDANEAIRIVDSLMYVAKNSGKNTIKFQVLGQKAANKGSTLP